MENFIKICGVTTEADALVAVGFGADALGFIFAPSPRQMQARQVEDIIKRLPPEVLTIGVFRNELPQRVVEITNTIGLGGAQLHGRESIDDTNYVASRVPLTIKGFSAGDPYIERFGEFGANLILIDSDSPGEGKVFDWRIAEGVVDPSRLIVAGGLTSDNVGEAIRHLRPLGVDVSSGVESAPGVKHPVKIRDFIRAAREAFEEVGEADPQSDAGPFDWTMGR